MKRRPKSANGSGSVFSTKLANGTVIWRGKYFANNVRKSITFGPEPEWNRTKARKALNALLTDVERGVYREPQKITLTQYASDALEAHIVAGGLKKSTASDYRRNLKKHLEPFFGNYRIAEISPSLVKKYIERKLAAGCSPRLVNASLQVLTLIFNLAIEDEIVATNPALKRRVKEEPREWIILGPEQVLRVEAAFDELIAKASGARLENLLTSKLIFILALAIGLRRGEVLGLKWKYIDLGPEPKIRVAETWVRNQWSTPKSATSRRTISIGPRLAKVLREHKLASHSSGGDERAVCNPRSGGAFDVHAYADLLSEALAEAGVGGRVRPFHDLRHSSLTQLAASGADSYAVQTTAGHSSHAITMRYLHLAGVMYRDEVATAEERIFGREAASAK